ncbi:MAG: polysaccharide biosynthesis tyrosine autokinase [bacterium]
MYRPEDYPPVHAKEHLRILAKHKWTAILFFSAVVGMTALYLKVTPPRYAAEVKMVIKPPPISPLTMMSEVLYSEGVDIVAKRTFVTTQFEVLKSRRLAERVLERTGLWEEYRVGQPRRSLLGPPGLRTREEAAEEFAGSIAVASPNLMSNHIELSYEHEDPQVAARVANAIVASYVEILYEDRSARIRENLEWLQAEFKKLEQDVLNSDQALQDFKKDRNLISVDDRENILLQKLNALNASLIQSRIARIAAENAYLDAKQLETHPNRLERSAVVLSTNPQIPALQGQLNLLRTEYARMQERYQQKHPKMIELDSTLKELEGRVRAEVLKAIESLKINYELARSQEESLVKELESVQKEVLDLGEQRINYVQLMNTSKVNRTVYDSLLNRLKETVVLQSFQTPNDTVQIIDSAVPPQKPSGFRVYFLPVAAGVGLLLGLFLCYVKDYFDTTLESDRDIHEALRLPTLGVLPKLKGVPDRKLGSFGKSTLVQPDGAYADHLQRLAHVLTHRADKGPFKTVLVMSVSPREGKTSIVSNLGIALARMRQRVLLVDGDFRKPRLHEIFATGNEHGFRDLLQSERDPADLIERTEVDNLFLLPSGPGLAAAAAPVLERVRVSGLLEQLKDRFDRILIDSPALLEVRDGAALATAADAVLWVVAAGRTTRERAFWALQSLTLLDRQILGVVLNGVRFLRGPTDYYANKR